MRYALLIYEDETAYGPGKDNEKIREMMASHAEFAMGLGAKRVGGAGLGGTGGATTVRARNGARAVHDGPFAETKEQLGGFYLIEAADLDEAIAIAKRTPLLDGGAVEVRPVLGG